MTSWKPKTGHPYWMVNSRWEVKQAPGTNSKRSRDRIKAGNCFKTRQEAVEIVEILKEQRHLTRWEHLKRALLP